MSEDETTTEVLAEIEGQVESTPVMEYTPPEGWRVVRFGEQLLPGDVWVSHDGTEHRSSILQWDASAVSGGHCIRRIEPEPEPEPEPQPVQVREGRWRTRNGEIRNVTPTPEDDDRVTQYPWYDAEYDQTWASNGRCYLDEESQRDLVQYVGPIEPQPEKNITPDDVAGEALAGVWDSAKAEQQIEELQAQVDFLKDRELKLGTRLQEEKAVTTKRLQHVEELRSEVHHVQLLLGESRQRNKELEALVADLRTINDAQEKAVKAAGRENADLQHRLDVVSKEWAEQAATFNGLQQQLEAVKAELVQVSKDRQALQIELDAREQVPQAVSDRFEEGWDAGTARAVETIAEWTAPFRTCGSQALAWAVLQNLPHIMRSLTGLTDED